MPCMFLLLWSFAVIGLWICAIRSFREASADPDPERKTAMTVNALIAAVPPASVFVVTAWTLLQVSPVVQFNAGSSRGMDLWSFWVHSWSTIFCCSGVQSVCYLIWYVAALVLKSRPGTETRRRIRVSFFRAGVSAASDGSPESMTPNGVVAFHCDSSASGAGLPDRSGFQRHGCFHVGFNSGHLKSGRPDPSALPS